MHTHKEKHTYNRDTRGIRQFGSINNNILAGEETERTRMQKKYSSVYGAYSNFTHQRAEGGHKEKTKPTTTTTKRDVH